MQERAKKILQWRESLNRLPDSHFFDLMRMYVGEIKTPYSKQNLIERLSTFLRQEEVINKSLSFLNEEEVLFLTAIVYIPFASMNKIVAFFEQDFSQREVREILYNLEERLLVFRIQNEESLVDLYQLNPHLENGLMQVCNKALLFAPFSAKLEQKCKKNHNFYLDNIQVLPFNASFLGSWISFISSQSDMEKADGAYKKKTELEIEDIFITFKNKSKESLQILTTALKNLDVVKEEAGRMSIDYSLLAQFADLEEKEQIAYFVVAATGYYDMVSLQNIAKLVLEIYVSLPKSCNEQVLYRSSFYIKENSGKSLKKSRVASLIEKQRSLLTETKAAKKDFDIIDILKKMYLFGLLESRNGEIVSKLIADEQKAGSVRLDAGFGVTVMPPISLRQLLPLIQFLKISKYDTVLHFEMTRKSCLNAFSRGLLPQSIAETLKTVTGLSISQSVEFSLNDWYESFSSVGVFKGYVVRIAPEKQRILEESGVFSKHIVEKLAEGVYVLDFEDDDQVAEIFIKSGLPFNGIRQTNKKKREISKKMLSIPTQNIDLGFIEKKKEHNLENVNQIQDVLFETLRKMQISKEEREALKSRIDRRIILVPEQLVAQSVRFEKTEAVGMDFLGKIQVIEAAMITESLLEITYEMIEKGIKKEEIVTGIPTNIEKQEGNAKVHLDREDTGIKEVFSVGKATKIRRIRGSIFKNRI